MMAQRFTSTEKWGDPWFRDLEPAAKLGYLYLIDRCDHAGIIDLDTKLAEFCIGCEVPWKDLIGSDRIHHIEGTKYWVVKFCQFQYRKGLKPGNSAHDSVIAILEKYNLLEALSEGLYSPCQGSKVKDKAKDKAKDGRGSAEGDELDRIESPVLRSAVETWVSHKSENRKKYKPQGLKALVSRCLNLAEQHGEQAVSDAITRAMANGWTGFDHDVGARGSPGKSTASPKVDFLALAAQGADDDAK